MKKRWASLIALLLSALTGFATNYVNDISAEADASVKVVRNGQF